MLNYCLVSPTFMTTFALLGIYAVPICFKLQWFENLMNGRALPKQRLNF